MPDLRMEDKALVGSSAMDNDLYLRGLVRKFNDARESGNRRDFAKENKTNALSFNIFRYMTSKHTNTGRFGARTEELFDYIDALDGVIPKGKYFDPFSLKTITEQDTAGSETGSDQHSSELTGDEDVEIDPDLENDAIIDAFTTRVGRQIRLAKENDFEAGRNGEDAIMALPQAIVEGMPDRDNPRGKKEITKAMADAELDRMISKYNAGRPLTPDGDVKEVIPDGFGIQLIVDEPAPEYTQEWRLFEAEQTKGVKARLKNFFRKLTFQKAPSKDELFSRFISTLPEYRELYRKGKELFDLVHLNDDPRNKPEYDPDTDPFIRQFKEKTSAVMKAKAYGHAIVRMKATKYGAPTSEYSFMFGSAGESGMAGTVAGVVSNPATVHSGAIKGDYKIRYSDYLNAAAKIRGTMGSMRTYSIMGYNCTSFAAEVARAANVPLNDDDTSSDVMNFRHHSQRVDSPALLARTLTARNQRLRSLVFSDLSTKDANDTREETLDARKQALYAQYGPLFEANHAEILGKIRLTQMATDQRISTGIRNLIGDIVNRGAVIDRNNPTTGLTDRALQEAEQRRVLGRQLEFGGSSTESEAVQACADDEGNLLRWIFMGTDKTRVLDIAAPAEYRVDVTDPEKDDMKKCIAQLRNTDLYKQTIKSMPPRSRRPLLEKLARSINNEQKQRIGELQQLIDGQDNWADIINSVDEYMQGESLRTLTLLAFRDENIVNTHYAGISMQAAASAAPVQTAASESVTDLAEQSSTDAEKPEVPKEVEDASESEPEIPVEPVNVEEPETDEAEVVQGDETAEAEEPARRGMIPVIAQRDIGGKEISQLIMSIDKEAAVRLFKDTFEMSASGFTGISARTGKMITRGEMANVLTVMSRQPNIADTIAEAYGKIISSASEDEKEILFESLLLDITLTDSIAVDALVKCGII